MWHVYNLVVAGDWVKCSTLRKVVKTGATGTTTSEKVRVTLELEVEEVVYDPKAEQIRIKGALRCGRGVGATRWSDEKNDEGDAEDEDDNVDDGVATDSRRLARRRTQARTSSRTSTSG